MTFKLRNILVIISILLSSSTSVVFSQPIDSLESVGLVLSGGGAKGISHIGVIKALEENNIPIDYIAGTSMGAIVGGLYAIGMTPDEMVSLLKSKEFRSWMRGLPEKAYASYLYRGTPTPKIMDLKVSSKPKKDGEKGGLKVSIMTSLVSPYPMDLAVMQIFASSAAVADYDFNNLMIPFFCVSADIVKKRPFISDEGDLGSAIRASMTFPGYFKPIIIDSTLLFDGGIYNNFPWDIMEEIHSPDFIIGAKCVKGEAINPSEDDPFKQLEAIMMMDTDYDIPADKGIVIDGEYDVSLLEFDRVDEIVQQGYENALKVMPEIRKRIKRELTAQERRKVRLDFRVKSSELRFNKLEIEGNLNENQKEYISKTITAEKDTFDFSPTKRGYYKIAASNTLNLLYPTAKINKDSLFTLNLKTTLNNYVGLEIGGNISSSSLNQAFIGLSHIHLNRNPWRASMGLDIGQYYTGIGVNWRQDFSVRPLLYYEFDLNIQRFDYFTSSQSLLISNTLFSNIQENESYLTLNFGTPISEKRSLVVEMGVTLGVNRYSYLETNPYADKTNLSYISPRILIEQQTFDYRLYPTSGIKNIMELRYSRISEKYRDSEDENMPNPSEVIFIEVDRGGQDRFLAKFYRESYRPISDWFSLGYTIDINIASTLNLEDYTSTLLAMPVFQPTVHSKTLLLEHYRAPIYAGAAISPIILFSPTFYVHSTIAYFQPYRQIEIDAERGYISSELFPVGSLLASLAVVWQSPIGPVSMSCSYYSKSKTKWYPQFNIGFLLFRERGLRN